MFLQRYLKSDNSIMFSHEESRHPGLLLLNNFVLRWSRSNGDRYDWRVPNFSSTLADKYRRIAAPDLNLATVDSFPFMRMPQFATIFKPLTKRESSSLGIKHTIYLLRRV